MQFDQQAFLLPAALAHPRHQGDPEIGLGREMVVDARRADADAVGQITEAERRPTHLLDEIPGGLEEGFAGRGRMDEDHGVSSTYR